jgi:glycosyltransferase involved in cell wall biosynthesis
MPAPVLFVISSNARRGAEIFGFELRNALRARGRVVDTVALAPGSTANALDVPVLGRRTLGLSTLRALRRRIEDASVVVSFGSRSLPACAIAAIGTGTPFVYRSIGDAIYHSDSAARRARVTLYLRRAQVVVALWPDAGRLLVSRHRVAPEKIRVIPRAVPADRFEVVDAARRADARRRLELPAAAPVALYMAALVDYKDPGTAVDAVALLPDTHLLVAGDGPDRSRIESYARERLGERAHFVGVIADPASAFAAANLLVLPSLTEGMPGVTIEAGLSGLPVVATDVGAVREVVIDGVSGVVVPPRDPAAIARGIEQALASAVEMGRNAREHCLHRFEIGVVSEAWDALLAAVEHDRVSDADSPTVPRRAPSTD